MVVRIVVLERPQHRQFTASPAHRQSIDDIKNVINPLAAIAMQALGNGVLGVVGFELAEWLPRMVERRRSGRG